MHHSNKMTSPRSPPNTSSHKLPFSGNQLPGSLSALSSSIGLAGLAANLATSSTSPSTNPLSLLSFLDSSSVTIPSGIETHSSSLGTNAGLGAAQEQKTNHHRQHHNHTATNNPDENANNKPTAEEDELVRRIHQKVGGPTKLSTYDDPACVRRVVIEALAREQRSPIEAQRIQRGQLSVSERRVVRTVTNRGAAVRSRMRQRREMAALRSEVRERDGRVRQLEAVVRALCSTYAVPLPATIVPNELDASDLQQLQMLVAASANDQEFNIAQTLDLTSNTQHQKQEQHSHSFNKGIIKPEYFDNGTLPNRSSSKGESPNTMNSTNIGRSPPADNHAPLLPESSTSQFASAMGPAAPCGNHGLQEDQMTVDLCGGSSSTQNVFSGFPGGENPSMSQLKWT